MLKWYVFVVIKGNSYFVNEYEGFLYGFWGYSVVWFGYLVGVGEVKVRWVGFRWCYIY